MKATEPYVSVVMPNYNKGPFAMEAVRSVLAQDYAQLELLFIDDASTDGSREQVERLAANEARLQCFALTQNAGGGTARNIGLEKSKGELLLFMDSDDWMAPGAISAMVKAFTSNCDFDFLAWPMALFDHTPGDNPRISNIPSAKDDLLRFFERDQPWLVSGPLWKRSFLQKLGGFDVGLSSQQDYDLHVRALLEKPRYQYFAKPAYLYYRQQVESAPRSGSQSLDALRQRALMLSRHLESLENKAMRSEAINRAIARYLLDLAQMMRWHKELLGEQSAQEGLRIWIMAHEYGLVSPKEYSKGMGYIRFKHNMLWNRVPALAEKLEERYRARLGDLLQSETPTLGRLTLEDV